MELYPQEFIQALDRQIRRQGHCSVSIILADNTVQNINEYKVESIEFKHANDPLSRRIPTETVTITLIDYESQWHPDAPNSFANRIEPKSKVELRIGIELDDGTTSWGPRLFYSITSRPTWNNYRATLTCTGLLGTLTKEFYQFAAGPMTLNALLKSISASAQIDPDNVSITTNYSGVFVSDHTTLGQKTVADAMLAVAVAAKGSLIETGGGYIRVADRYSQSPDKNPVIIRTDDMYELPVSQKDVLIQSENVSVIMPPETAGTEEVVVDYSSSEVPTEQKPIFIRFDKPILPDTFQFVMTPDPNWTSLTSNQYRDLIKVSDVVRSDTSQPFVVKGKAVCQNPTKSNQSVEIDSDGTEDEIVNNPLITPVNAVGVAQYRGGYLKNTRSCYSIRYRGDPTIEALDLIRVELPFDGIQTCIVLESTFRFGNGFSGTLVVRKLETVSQEQTITSAISDSAISDVAVSDEET